jgi:hypothetical protein
MINRSINLLQHHSIVFVEILKLTSSFHYLNEEFLSVFVNKETADTK